ncbi:terminase small subunit [Clostridium manihotivorum]|uniref:Uncharacterized protein n=1 Tax=Clostridium manihotivorum TaxID=2320868 RepID=A0A410DQC2_9CLOT|nr:terminase small subunit [Clostridium manihotivorum]QAA31235.1 hypothetical protein C1I91_06015 [Clostridium manihotivorum]
MSGNQGKGGGKPLKWKSPKELQNKIDEYFKWAENNKKHVSVTGLAWWLRCDRSTLLNYENAEENGWLNRLNYETKMKYVSAIKEAKLRIEAEYEDRLFYKNSVTGAIFTLKNNYGWVDKQEIVNTDNNINITLKDE